jgi:uncharacterized heparinase superfamily protein
MWAEFRVGQRARVRLHSLRQSEQEIVVAASHDGYRRLPGRNVHRRQWTFGMASMQIDDELDGAYERARAHFHLHPDIGVSEAYPGSGRLVLGSRQGARIEVSVSGGSLAIEGSTWHPRFGASIPNQRLVATFDSPRLSTHLRWRRDG